MATTYTSFLTALGNLTVTGVARKYTLAESPPQVEPEPADYPAQFLDGLSGTSADGRTMSGGYGTTYHATLIILCTPPTLDTPAANMADVCALTDALQTALVAAAATLTSTDTDMPSWVITAPPGTGRIECVVTAVGV